MTEPILTETIINRNEPNMYLPAGTVHGTKGHSDPSEFQTNFSFNENIGEWVYRQQSSFQLADGVNGLSVPGFDANRVWSRWLELRTVSKKELERDLEMFNVAVTRGVSGFRLGRVNRVFDARRWESGPVYGVRMYGQGFCYLVLFRPLLRVRIARLLGPFPLVSDVRCLFALCGDQNPMVAMRAIVGSMYHVEYGHRADGVEVYRDLTRIMDADPMARLGADEDDFGGGVQLGSAGSRDSVGGQTFVEPGLKAYCPQCGFIVRVLGHEERCKIKVGVDRTLALIGDALHALDVKLVLAHNRAEILNLTEAVKVYVAASAQAEYMRSWYADEVRGMNDRECSNAFEVTYFGEFREAYVKWLYTQHNPPSSGVDPEGFYKTYGLVKNLGGPSTLYGRSFVG